VARELLAQPRPIGREDAGEEAMVLREAGARAERLLVDGCDHAFGELDESRPGLGLVGTRPHDEGGASRLRQERLEARNGSVVYATRADDLGGRSVLAVVVDLRRPIVHRHDDDRRPACARRLVVRAGDRAGDVLCAHGLVDPHRVFTGEAGELARQERLEDEVATVLLADDDDERRAVHPRRRDRADGVAEARGRVQQRQARLAAADRVPGRHADDRAFVQSEHEADVLRKAGEERHLGRAGVGEHRRQPVAPEDAERGLADRVRHGRLCAPPYRVHTWRLPGTYRVRVTSRLPPRPRRSAAASPTAPPR
jgi:hypothetical protein